MEKMTGSQVSQPYATLYNGQKMALMGFGVLMENLDPDQDIVASMVESALEIGYRQIDTASVYKTEIGIGKAVRRQIEKGAIKRKDVFITTKVWRTDSHHDDVVQSVKNSLQRFQLAYIDLVLIHWPGGLKPGDNLFPKDDKGKLIYDLEVDYLETWKALEECVNLGLTRSIGLSNFNSKQIQRILDNCKIRPVNNQIECHPFLSNTKIINFCREKEILVTAYCPLAGFNYCDRKGIPTIYEDKTIGKIAKNHSKTNAQVALRFQIQRGVAVVPKSAQKERQLENFQALNFELTEEEMKEIESCNKGFRLCNDTPDHPHYPFNEEY